MKAFNTESFHFLQFNPNEAVYQDFFKLLTRDKDIADNIKLKEIEEDIKNFVEGISSFLITNYNEDFMGILTLNNGGHQYPSLDWAILKDFRGIRYNNNETVGSKILREASNYLLLSDQELKVLRLYIAEKNISSLNAALHAGFVPFDRVTYMKRRATDYVPNPPGIIRRSG